MAKPRTRQTVEAFALNMPGDYHAKKCCTPAREMAPPVRRGKAKCKGKIWSVATPGNCKKNNDKAMCWDGVTAVEIYEYELNWDARKSKCIATKSGRSHLVQVSSCTGDYCD